MKKTLKKRAFISAIAMLIVSAIVLTSSTFAWFAMATQVNVDSMELNITSLDGIVFSANTTNWTTKLTSADFANDQSSQYRYGAYVGNQNNLPEKLAPVSSSMYVRNQNPGFFSGSIDDKGFLTANSVTNSEAEKKAPYVAIDLFIKVATSETVTWRSTLSVNKGDLEDPLYAMRVAVVNCGKVEEKAEAEAILAKVSNDSKNATVWEMDNTKHTDTSGVANGTSYKTIPLGASVPKISLGTGHVMSEGIYTRALDATYATGDAVKTFSVTPGVTKLRVYIWLEGQDCDCESAIAGAIVKCGLSFSIVG